jgi:hypothetical protein
MYLIKPNSKRGIRQIRNNVIAARGVGVEADYFKFEKKNWIWTFGQIKIYIYIYLS